MATTNRAVRVPDETWHPAVAKAAEEGTTVTAVVNKALEAYLRKPAPKRRPRAATKTATTTPRTATKAATTTPTKASGTKVKAKARVKR